MKLKFDSKDSLSEKWIFLTIVPTTYGVKDSWKQKKLKSFFLYDYLKLKYCDFTNFIQL